LAWSAMSSDTGQHLYAISGAHPAMVFAVGAGLVRYDGPSWELTSGASFNPNGRDLQTAWAAGPNDIFVAGYSGVIGRWNGTSWTPMTPANVQTIFSLWGSEASNVFAVGFSGTVQRWNGSSWSAMTSGTTAPLFGVWGSGPNDVFAVGGTLVATPPSVIRHWNGSSWSTMTSPITQPLGAVWGSGPNDVYAVGNAGKIIRWNGSTWAEVLSTNAAWTGIWGSGPNDVFAVGSPGRIHHFDGTTWAPMESGTSALLTGVWGTGPADVYATGLSGTLLHYDGFSWTPMATGTTTALYAVTGPGELFAVGDAGVVLHRPRVCGTSEQRCGDGRDDDCDGRVDCADPDCAGDAKCQAGGLCAGWTAVACNTSVSGTTSGGPSRMDRYACSAWLDAGREAYFRVQRATSGPITISLTNLAKDLDLIVLGEAAGGGCDPRSPHCKRASSTGGTSEQVSFTATAGTPYYVVIDGYGSHAGTFTLTASCP
jgi:hypothetical protein